MCRKKCSPVRRKVRKYTAVILSVFILFTTYFELAVKAQLRDVIIRDMQTLSEQAVTAAVEDYLSENADENCSNKISQKITLAIIKNHQIDKPSNQSA